MAELCPCCSSKAFNECCGPFLRGEREPTTPEELMRSRYTAYTLKDLDYVQRTTDPQAVLEMDLEASRAWAESSHFFKLEVLSSGAGGNKGQVEFKAHFRDLNGQEFVHHERSKFRKQHGRWYFRDGRIVPDPKANPN